MVRKLMKTLLLSLVLAVAAPLASAQCVSDVPDSLTIDHAYCIQVCPFEFYTFQVIGYIDGPDATPVITLTAGCTRAGGCVEDDCTPIEPPSIQYLFDDLNDRWYWGGSNGCLDIRWYWVHHEYWNVEIFSTCEGCFCFLFDDQLSVELGNFDAVAGNSTVTLNWSTRSETDNDRFVIQRDQQDVASVRAQGNSATGHAYSWTDNGLTNGQTYAYTLIAVNTSGTRETLGQVAATPSQTTGMVTDYRLHQNYPNPFNPSTRIAFDLKESEFVTLKIYNPMGEEVAVLVNGQVPAGQHSVEFDASKLPSGLYFYTMKAGNGFSAARKMLLVK